MSEVWITTVALIATSGATKAIGPLALGGRTIPPRLVGVITLLAPALLAALIVVQTVGGDEAIVIDERLAGVAAAGALLLLRPSSILPAITLAAVVTALLRL